MEAIPGVQNVAMLPGIRLLVINTLVALICLVAGPRFWSRKLCFITVWINIFLLFVAAVWLFALLLPIVISGYREETQFIYGVVLCPILPLLLQVVALLAIYRWRLKTSASPL